MNTYDLSFKIIKLKTKQIIQNTKNIGIEARIYTIN